MEYLKDEQESFFSFAQPSFLLYLINLAQTAI